MKLEPRVSMITLGVENVSEATAFYERLGWQRSSASQDAITFIRLNGIVLGLFGRDALAKDAGFDPNGVKKASFSGVTLAYNVRNKQTVDDTLAFAVTCGAKLEKPAQNVLWGGYSGYFSDPDGHVWEVAFNPFAPLDDAGHLSIPL